MRIKAEIFVGSEVTGTIREAITLCSEMRSTTPILLDRRGNLYAFTVEDDTSDDVTVSFEFNGVTVNVVATSDPDLIYRDWSRALSGYIEKAVGPNPNPALTDEEQANDDRIEAENERKRQERQAEYNAKATAKLNATEAKLADAPEMEFSDSEAWQQAVSISTVPGVITFAERWARLMQLEIANGQKLEDIAYTTTQEADTEGISGFMYGAAVSTLASCWKYGDQLRRWHNINTQLGDEGERANETGGTLNPALLNIGS